jgi:hypothetical protein
MHSRYCGSMRGCIRLRGAGGKGGAGPAGAHLIQRGELGARGALDGALRRSGGGGGLRLGAVSSFHSFTRFLLYNAGAYHDRYWAAPATEGLCARRKAVRAGSKGVRWLHTHDDCPLAPPGVEPERTYSGFSFSTSRVSMSTRPGCAGGTPGASERGTTGARSSEGSSEGGTPEGSPERSDGSSSVGSFRGGTRGRAFKPRPRAQRLYLSGGLLARRCALRVVLGVGDCAGVQLVSQPGCAGR